jgi:hypothetical protein
MQALCGVLAVGVPVSVAYAQVSGGAPVPEASPASPAPSALPPGPADPWTSPDGNAPPPAYGADAYGAPAAGYPGAPGYAGGMIQVDLKADQPGVRLDRVQGGGAATAVCLAPCSRLVPRNNLYVIDGDGIRATSQFLLPDDRNQVTLDVKAGSAARHGGGAALMVGGLIVGYIGMLVLEVGLTSQAVSDGTTQNRSDSAATVGGVMLAAGVAAAVGGLYLVMTSSTKVSSSTGATFTEDERPRPRPRSGIALTPRGLTF